MYLVTFHYCILTASNLKVYQWQKRCLQPHCARNSSAKLKYHNSSKAGFTNICSADSSVWFPLVWSKYTHIRLLKCLTVSHYCHLESSPNARLGRHTSPFTLWKAQAVCLKASESFHPSKSLCQINICLLTLCVKSESLWNEVVFKGRAGCVHLLSLVDCDNSLLYSDPSLAGHLIHYPPEN